MIKHRIEAKEIRAVLLDGDDLLKLVGLEPTKHKIRNVQLNHNRSGDDSVSVELSVVGVA